MVENRCSANFLHSATYGSLLPLGGMVGHFAKDKLQISLDHTTLCSNRQLPLLTFTAVIEDVDRLGRQLL